MDNLEPLAFDNGQTEKMEVDYSTTCDDKISIAQNLASGNKLQEALNMLLELEKQTRTVNIYISVLILIT